MRFVFWMVSLMLTNGTLIAQVKDTIRENVDYRQSRNPNSQSSRFETPDYEKKSKNYHYWGLQANQLLQQLFNFSGNDEPSGNPYVLTYSFNSVETGSGLSFGLGYLSRTVEDVDQGLKRSTKTSDIQFRMGYEKKTRFGKRWVLGRGVDFLLSRGVDETNVDGSGGIDFESKTTGWGIGPRMSVMFSITDQVLMGTELSWYFQHAKTEGKFPTLPNSNSDLKEKSFNLQMPTAIFLTLKF